MDIDQLIDVTYHQNLRDTERKYNREKYPEIAQVVDQLKMVFGDDQVTVKKITEKEKIIILGKNFHKRMLKSDLVTPDLVPDSRNPVHAPCNKIKDLRQIQNLCQTDEETPKKRLTSVTSCSFECHQ